MRVVLTAGVLEPLDDDQVKRVEADATLKKPFEASVLIATVRPLAERAVQDRSQLQPAATGAKAAAPANPATVPFVTVVDAEQVRAAVTVALDAAMEKMVDEISRRVLAVLNTRKSSSAPGPIAPEVASTLKPVPPPVPKPSAEAKKPAEPAVPTPRLETVRRVSPLRSRPGSILGLELNYAEPEVPAAAPRSPAADPLFPNARPAADPDPGSRAGIPNPRPAFPNSRPAPNSDPGPHPAGPDKK